MSSKNSQKTVDQINTTQVPNILLDHWINLLSAIQIRILMSICRDATSVPQISSLTKISEKSVIKELKNLQDFRLVNNESESFVLNVEGAV